MTKMHGDYEERAAMPPFSVPASCIVPLESPQDFYKAIIQQIELSNDEISLAALYLGTGNLEKAIVDALNAAIKKRNVRVLIQLDFNRNLRIAPPLAASKLGDTSKGPKFYESSAHLLSELFTHEDSDENVLISLALLPQFRNISIAKLLPPRVSEGAGVFHCKAYVFDSRTVLLSGANLSSDYFTDRQDRYVLIRATEDSSEAEKDAVAGFANYLHETLRGIATLPGSYRLLPAGVVTPGDVEDGKWSPLDQEKCNKTTSGTVFPLSIFHPTMWQGYSLNTNFEKGLRELLSKQSTGVDGGFIDDDDKAILYPRWNLGVANVNNDVLSLHRLLENLKPLPTTLHMATGYFNVSEEVQDALLKAKGSSVSILTASPLANGFLGSKGISGAIPAVYSEIERLFLDRAEKAKRLMPSPGEGMREGISMMEYERVGWTFHAKGIWLDEKEGFITSLGSSNFGTRSANGDLEFQVEIATRNQWLMERFRTERNKLWGGTKEATVKAVGPMTNTNVFQTPLRRIEGWSWTNGTWIHVARKTLSKFF